MKVQLKYNFVFDPAETWAHRQQFESSFANYLNQIGLQAEPIKSLRDYDGTLMLFISKRDVINPEEPSTKSVKKRVSEMKQKKDSKGRFRRSDGTPGRNSR